MAPEHTAQILPAIRAFNLEEFLFNPSKSPYKFVEIEDEETGESIQTLSDDYLKWKKKYQLLMCWIPSTLSKSSLGQVTQCIMAHELWSCIISLFSQQSMARTMYQRHQLQTVKKGALSINEFMVKMKGIADSLTASYQVITEQDLVSCILGGVV
ncbi:hypothetical protein Ddye_012785 [Dipteronia dyeriana]|uniref:Retrotransposon gag domain-containing protein n=1 Tax=Dipteronia dyeriana TaxID=168575 RepID=A0AAE0CJ04_9ROSI|nr:hypothetical protein Ddye_012785 [Dipteronia dyeriana]